MSWRSWPLGRTARTSALIAALLLAGGLNRALAADFCVNPGFENGPGGGGEASAPPWSYWGGTGGAIANPVPTADNNSPRVWSNFGNPTYVNVAAQNNMSGVWLVPGATYHIHAQYYVPSSEVVSGITPRAGIYWTLMSGYQIRVLDPRYPDANVPPAPNANIPVLDAWYTIDYDFVCPAADGSGNPLSGPTQLSYMSFRLYGGDGTTLGVNNPGGYFDNCECTSPNYRNDLHGLVKDNSGNPVAGATVVLYSAYSLAPNYLDTTTTLADGSYSFSTNIWAPYGYDFAVDASKPPYSSDGPKDVVVSSTAATFPLLTLTPPSTHITGTVTGLPTGRTAQVQAVGNLGTVTTTTALDGTYSMLAANDTYTVAVTGMFPLSAPAQIVTVAGADVTGVDFALTATVPLVDVNAASTTAGAPVTALANNGSLGGVFIPGGPGSGPNAPLSTVVHGYQTLYFDGSEGMGLVSTANHAVAINAPATIVGNYPSPNPVFTLVAWVWRSALDGNQGIFSWAPFFYGANFQYGNGWAADHFGSGNLGWSAEPAAGSWHQLVYTSDGTTENVYADGVVAGTATAPTAFLNVDDYSTLVAQTSWNGAANPLALGQIEDNDPYNWFDTRNFSGAIAAVQVYDVAVTTNDVAGLYANYVPTVGTSYTVSGHIYGPDGTTGIDGASVSALNGAAAVAGPVITSGGGAYSLSVGPGTYTIAATAAGYRAGSLAGVAVASADVTGQNMTLAAIPADRLAISIDAAEATAAGVTNRGYYGGTFVPVQGTPALGLAGPALDPRVAISFSYQFMFLETPGGAQIAAGNEVCGNAPFTVVAWVYQNTASFNNGANGQRDTYFSWVPLGAGGSAAGCGLGWREWGGAFPGYNSGGPVPTVNWPGYNSDFATSMTACTAPWNGWYQVVTLYDGTKLHFYTNGVERTDMLTTYNLTTMVGQTFALGGESAGGAAGVWGDSAYWGSIARLKMYSKALTQAEINADLANPGGHPTLPLSGFSRPGGVPTFQIPNTLSGVQYTLVYKNSLTDPAWTPLTGSGTHAGTGGAITLSDPTPVGSLPPERLYRLELQ